MLEDCSLLAAELSYWGGFSFGVDYLPVQSSLGKRGMETKKENLCSLLSIGTRFLSEGSAVMVQPSFRGLACRPHCIGG